MADVHGRLTGKAGSVSPPWGLVQTNLLTGVADAYLDRAPLVAINGTGLAGSDAQRIASVHRRLVHVQASHEMERRDLHPRTIAETVRKAFKVGRPKSPARLIWKLPEDVAEETVSDGELDGPLRVQAPFLPSAGAPG